MPGVADVALVEVNEQTSSTFGLLTETKDGDGTHDTKYDYAYGDDGVRIGQTVTNDTDDDGSFADETPVETVYLVDGNNPTDYAQVLEEKDAAGNVTKTYTLGLDVLAQQTPAIESGSTLFLLRDGHGSTRGLVDATGQPLAGQVFRYDAFGNRLDTSDALTTLLYSGEQTDATGLQYLRARYYDPASGRFNRLDPFAGNVKDPQSLHKYLYCHVDAVNGVDPSGEFFFTLGGLLYGHSLSSEYSRTTACIGAAIGAAVDYLGLIQMGNIQRWFNGPTTTVNVYVAPLTGLHSTDPDFTSYRRYLLMNTAAVEQRMNNVNRGITTFNIIDGSLPGGSTKGYNKKTKTINIVVEWRDSDAIIAQGVNGRIGVYPKTFKSHLQCAVERGSTSARIDDKTKATYLANMLLHETAHVVLEQNPLRQWGGYRDHTASGLMGGFPWGDNMTFNVASQSILDYDGGTKAEMRAALGSEWAWY